MKYLEFIKINNPNSHVYYIYGNDTYLKKLALDRLLSFVDEGMKELNIVYPDPPYSMTSIVEDCMVLPFGSQYRACVIRDFNVKMSRGEEDALDKYILDADATTILIFVEDSKNDFLKNFKKKIVEIDCSKLDILELKTLVAEMVVDMGINIESSALELLITYCDRFLDKIEIELLKLKAYCIGRTIEYNDVKELVNKDSEYLVFELSNALSDKNGAKAYEIVDNMLATNNAPSYLLAVISKHFRRMLHIRLNSNMSDRELASYLRVSEYSIAKTKRTATKFSQSSLKKISDRLADLEFEFKRGKLIELSALSLAIVSALTGGV